ncbi:hypothetical protein [Bilophila wadsworthia]|uniref:hypothetical protein n=1 Tax=Bilophila wadsworthia TaxID=35833 RepID=UPI0024320085|nr:hypothetical protein [Bilophila wadsworthia]
MRDLPFLLRLHSRAPLARFKGTTLPRRPLKNIISARYLSGDTFINDNAPCFKRFSISDFDYDEILCFLRLACPLPSLFKSLDKKFEDSFIPRPFRHHGSLRYRTPVWRIVLREQKQKLEFQTRPGCFKGSALEFFAYKRKELKERNWTTTIEWLFILGIFLMPFGYTLLVGIVLTLLQVAGWLRPVSSRIVRCFLRRHSYV